jgi:hypothetical protein
MALIIISLSALAISVYGGEPSRDLVDIETNTKAAFFDYDRTVLIESFGGKVRDWCVEQDISTETGCSGEGDLVVALDDLAEANGTRIEIAFGGERRIARLADFFETLSASTSSIPGANIFILSTAWEPIPAVEWEDMIYASLEYVGLDVFFNRSNILGLLDPGPGKQADKGAKLKVELDRLEITEMAECVFADDKEGNLNYANCEGDDWIGKPCADYGGTRKYCDVVLIFERDGMDGTDLNYFEARSIFPPEQIAGGYMVKVNLGLLVVICAYLC